MDIDSRQLQRWSEDVARQINELGKHVNDLRQFQMHVEYDKQIESAQQLAEKLQSNAASYTNLIIVGGYAAFFTFWATLRGEMPSWLFATAGFLITSSLLIFISWEIGKMVWTSVHLNRIQQQLTSEAPSPDVLKKFQSESASFGRRMHRLWPWFMIPSVLLGLGAGLTLLGFFLYRLWNGF